MQLYCRTVPLRILRSCSHFTSRLAGVGAVHLRVDRMEGLMVGWTVDRTEGQTVDRTEGQTVDRTEGQTVDRRVGWTVDRRVGRTADRRAGWTVDRRAGQMAEGLEVRQVKEVDLMVTGAVLLP